MVWSLIGTRISAKLNFMGIHEKVRIEKVYTGIDRRLELIDVLLMNSISIYGQMRASTEESLLAGTRDEKRNTKRENNSILSISFILLINCKRTRQRPHQAYTTSATGSSPSSYSTIAELLLHHELDLHTHDHSQT